MQTTPRRPGDAGRFTKSVGHRRRALSAAFVLALGAGCGRQLDVASTNQAPAPPGRSAPGVAAGPLVTGSATARTVHDGFAANGIACAGCHACGAAGQHALAWMDPGSSGFHAASANAGLASCQGCHGANLDGVGGSTTIACAQCHGASWRTSCTMCHGGTDGATGAPPRATWGNGADAIRIGAHTSHLTARHGLAAPVACAACHVVPADALAAGHIDGATATVMFSGLAARGAPSWTRATATCAGVYCHGATLAGGSRTAPSWTVTDGSQVSCGTCHGLPPPAPHVARTDCATCHGSGYTATTVAAATHVDGTVDLQLTCTSCHGQAGQPATATSPLAAAPPVDTSGAAAGGIRIGAHQAHLVGRAYSSGTACRNCHPAVGAYVTTHSNGIIEVAFTNGTSPSFNVGTYTRGSGTTAATCASTWCHAVRSASGSSSGGTLRTPSWTGTITGCTACHGTPPGTGHHQMSDHVRPGCGACHSGYGSISINPTLHVNGARDVGGTGTRINSYDPSTRRCYPQCHGNETW